MPQMAPLNWLSLFIMFILIFLIFNFLNYYSFLYQPKLFNQTLKSLKIDWKW
uniref:ATP synthase complex subunit 8 n=1 Tax=Staphylinidae sp. BMNH 1274706 TaxID=1796599 RepID=A0A140EG22_9COLE|nr:ATP synthase F0 subunit 8 [Staphylinidae sp. BMNH 1274706]